MPKPRKTIEVGPLLAKINNLLDSEEVARGFATPEEAVAYRKGLCQVLEDMLHSTGTYAGFRWTEKSCMYGKAFATDEDDYRRHYYKHSSL